MYNFKLNNLRMAHVDPYDYPTLQRADLMSLSKISSFDERCRKIKGGLETNRDYSYNLFNMDIVGIKKLK